MISIMSFIICFGLCLIKLRGITAQPLHRPPVTLYRGDWKECGNSEADNDYYEVPFCVNAVPPGSTQLQVTLEVPQNPDFKPTPANIICIQLSACKGNFTQGCGFAKNYVYNGTVNQIYAFANLVININRFCADVSNCVVYIRAMAQSNRVEYSMQLTFVSSKPEHYLPLTDNDYFPWSGGVVSNGDNPDELDQYWRSDEIYQASVNEFTYFYIGYCSQKQTPVSGIEIASVSPTDNTITLLQTFACTKNSVDGDYTKCTYAAAQKYHGCYHRYVTPFYVLSCDATEQRSLEDGLYVVVNTLGNSTTQPNEFMFQAIINTPSQIKFNKTNKYKL